MTQIFLMLLLLKQVVMNNQRVLSTLCYVWHVGIPLLILFAFYVASMLSIIDDASSLISGVIVGLIFCLAGSLVFVPAAVAVGALLRFGGGIVAYLMMLGPSLHFDVVTFLCIISLTIFSWASARWHAMVYPGEINMFLLIFA